MDERAGPSLGLTLLAVLVLAYQDLISGGNSGHTKTSTVLLGPGKDHTLLPEHSAWDYRLLFPVVWAPGFRHVWERPQDCTQLMQNKVAVTPEPLEVLLLPWSALLFLPQHLDGTFHVAGVWHSPSSTWCRVSPRAECEERGGLWGFTSWQKADCASALSVGRWGIIPTTHPQGLQDRQRVRDREKLQPILPWEQGRRCEGSQPLAARSPPGLEHQTRPAWLGFWRGSSLTWRKSRKGTPPPVSCWLIRWDKCCCNEERHLGALSSHTWHFPWHLTWQATGSLCFCRANINTD